MAKYAIVKLGGFQYTLEEGKSYKVPKFDAEDGKDFIIEEVFAVGDGEHLELGTPTVKTKVTLVEVTQEKGEKVTTRVYKAKSRYRRVRGHRKLVTGFKVGSIGGAVKKAAKAGSTVKPKATVKSEKAEQKDTSSGKRNVKKTESKAKAATKKTAVKSSETVKKTSTDIKSAKSSKKSKPKVNTVKPEAKSKSATKNKEINDTKK